ncbi:MAG: hypothetical protein ACD_54C00217G0001 [uncultured bacterium]|nr:MAG: hypothetical protein ACD_54C00217G0001 [uncultured bacterium]
MAARQRGFGAGQDLRQIAQRCIRFGGGGLAQIGFGRHQFLVAAQDACGVGGLHLTAHPHLDFRHRACHRPTLHPIARPIAKAAAHAAARYRNNPVQHLLAVKARRCQPVALHHPAHRAVVAIQRGVIDIQQHYCMSPDR